MDWHIFIGILERAQIKFHLYIPDRKYDRRYEPRNRLETKSCFKTTELLISRGNVHFDCYCTVGFGLGGSLLHMSYYYPLEIEDREHWNQNFKLLRIPNPLSILRHKRFEKKIRNTEEDKMYRGLGGLFG